MSMLKSLAGGAVLFLALAGGLRAEVTVSHSNNPAAAAEQWLLSLMFNERNALSAVSSARVAALTKAPKSKSKKVNSDQLACLSQALYHEARGEGRKGQKAVAEVVLNRVDDPAFPDTVCGVVYQSNRRGCQFSWTCDGKSDKIREEAAFASASEVARNMLLGEDRSLTDGATYFHTPAVKPSWSRKFKRTAKIGAHIFYSKAPRRTATN